MVDPPKLSRSELTHALGFIEAQWGTMERYCPTDSGTLVGLPHPYFTPGSEPRDGFMHNEMYYWDTYFIAAGLLIGKRKKQAYEQADNLLFLLKKFGMIPSANRTYFTARSQPPLLTTLLLELYDQGGSKEWLRPRIELAKLEYQNVWRGQQSPHWREVFQGLSRNYEINVLPELAECESGWDYTTRFRGQALDNIPIDLNALLYKYEMDFARAAIILGKDKEAIQWHQRASVRRANVDKYLWNQSAGFYFDYNYKTGRKSNVWSLAAYYVMWAGMASEEQAASLVDNLSKFEQVGGLTTTLDYPHVKEHHPAQWTYPNGWAPLHLLTVRGLSSYGYDNEATRIARRWLGTNLYSFNKYGQFYEKYNVVDLTAAPKDGVYPCQVGFAWTNAVFAILAKEYGSEVS